MDWISSQEAANILDVTPAWIAWLCRNNVLKAKKPGREWWVDKGSVIDYKARIDSGEIKRRGSKASDD